MPELHHSPKNPNRLEIIDSHFGEGGAWEKNGGREQTKNLAKSFVKNIKIPYHKFTLLDLGCALGDATPVFRSAYPNASLFGCDVSHNAIRRCNNEYGHLAFFFECSIEKIDRHFDVIYCSNLMEHIENYVEVVQHLANFANILYVMVPYKEYKNGKPLSPDMGEWHVNTLDENSFRPLEGEGKKISYKIFKSPGGWGPKRWQIPLIYIKSKLLRRPYIKMEQIVYEIKNKH